MSGDFDDDVADALFDIAGAARSVGRAITPEAMPGEDAVGGHVASLTEAVMGITGALTLIATAIESLAEAVRDAHT